MNREIAELWIKDLRSNPPQAKGVLFDGVGYCCLGRLCELAGMKPVVRQYEEEKAEYLYDGEQFLLPVEIRDWAGMKSIQGNYKNTNLARDNDNGETFAQIADIIEAHVDEL